MSLEPIETIVQRYGCRLLRRNLRPIALLLIVGGVVVNGAPTDALRCVAMSPQQAISKEEGATDTKSRPLDQHTRGPGARDAESELVPNNLARGSYADRQRATLEMWRKRSLSRQAVQDAARDSDPEVAQRAEWILRQWRSGVLPGVKGPNGQNVLDQDGSAALAWVLEQGAFDAVLVAVEESAGTIEFDQTKSRVARLLSERYPMYCDRAVTENTETDLLKLLDAVAVNRDVATARRDLMLYLNIPLNESNRLPSSASGWSEADKQICLSQFAMLRGETEESINRAAQADDPVLIRITNMLGGRWNAIADRAFEDAANAGSVEERVEAYAWAFAAAYRTEDQEQKAKAQTALEEILPGEPETVTNIRWRSLALHDQLADGIALLGKSRPADAASLATASSRFVLASEFCGYDLPQIDSDLDDWLNEAMDEQTGLPAGSMAPKIRRLYSLARLLVNTGDRDNAYRIYERLTPREIIVMPNGVSLREQTLNELDLVNQLDWMLELAVSSRDNAASQRTRRIAANALNTEYESFQKVLDHIREVIPATNFRERFQATFQLFRGKTPEGFDSDQDFSRLYSALANNEEISRSFGRVVRRPRMLLDLEIVEMFMRQQQVDLAGDALLLLTRNGDLKALIALAEQKLDQGDYQAAGSLWERIRLRAEQFTATESVITMDRGLSFAKSVVGSWILARRAGHHERAEDLESRIRLMLTSPSLTFRKDLADHLRETKQFDLAAEALRELIILSSFGGTESPDFFRVAVAYVGALDQLKESDPSAVERLGIDPRDSVVWSDLAVLGILKSSMYYDTAFVSVPLSIRKTFLQHAIDTADRDMAESAIRQIDSYDPLNIDYGERMLPDLAKAGMKDLAGRSFQGLFDRGLQHVKNFPRDTTALNNLAWTAAMNERSLEKAEELSMLAVTKEPDSVVYRDTLAEILHLRGFTAEAMALEKACLLDEPDEWHLHQQIEKFEKALAE